MNKFIYIKFQSPFYNNFETRSTISIKKSIIKILTFFLPKSNPDFERKYDSVKIWLLEFDKEGNYVNREIGIDDKGIIILISPYKRNLGYWIDSNLMIEDYQKFYPETITFQEFENHWNNFIE